MQNTTDTDLFDGPRPCDDELVLTRLSALVGAQVSDAIVFTHNGPPICKARARWSKHRVYTPKRTTEAQASVARAFRAALHGRRFTGGVAIVALFYRQNRQRVDLDNLSKLVLDAGTAAEAWIDDSQVTAHTSTIDLDERRPRTVIALCASATNLTRARVYPTTVCAHCGATFQHPHHRKGTARFCSKRCSELGRLREVTCPRCDDVFRRTVKGQRFCGPVCAAQPRRLRVPRIRTRPRPNCQKCGVEVSRREYHLCRRCWLTPRPEKLTA